MYRPTIVPSTVSATAVYWEEKTGFLIQRIELRKRSAPFHYLIPDLDQRRKICQIPFAYCDFVLFHDDSRLSDIFIFFGNGNIHFDLNQTVYADTTFPWCIQNQKYFITGDSKLQIQYAGISLHKIIM